MSDRKPLFSVTRDDLEVETFRGSGAGGQNRNKRDTGVRIRHPASGAVGESCDERMQAQNKKTAFHRMIESRAFQSWVRVQAAARFQGYRDAEAKVEEQMVAENLRVEFFDPEVPR